MMLTTFTQMTLTVIRSSNHKWGYSKTIKMLMPPMQSQPCVTVRSSDHCFAISIAWQLLRLNLQYFFFELWYCSDILEQLSSKCFSSVCVVTSCMIPCSYDVIVGGDALDFVNLSIFSHFFAIKFYVSSYIRPKRSIKSNY